MKERDQEKATLLSLGILRQQLSQKIFHVSSKHSKISRIKAKAFPSRLRVACVSVGSQHGIVVSEDRTVFAWGSNEFGQLGHGASGVLANYDFLVCFEVFCFHAICSVSSGLRRKSTTVQGSVHTYQEPTPVKALTGKSIISACAGVDFSVFLSKLCQ